MVVVFPLFPVELLGCHILRYPEFGTAVVTMTEDKLKVDVATSRLEYYPQPVALPTVELSSLKMDMFRRDFTINAMAIQLNLSHYGRLVRRIGLCTHTHTHTLSLSLWRKCGESAF
jgi:tRNA nucleotidyltransferase (CCA-adding enzyme)